MLIADVIKRYEPYIFFVKIENFDRIVEQFFNGAVDLVIEIISPKSAIRDMQEKFINPSRRTANFYNLDEDGKHKIRYPSVEDKFESRVVEGLWIKTDWLWQTELPNLMNILKDWKLIKKDEFSKWQLRETGRTNNGFAAVEARRRRRLLPFFLQFGH